MCVYTRAYTFNTIASLVNTNITITTVTDKTKTSITLFFYSRVVSVSCLNKSWTKTVCNKDTSFVNTVIYALYRKLEKPS